MRILSWNVRGLGNPQTFRAVKKLIAFEDPKVIFLIEIKLEAKSLKKLRLKLKMEDCFGVD